MTTKKTPATVDEIQAHTFADLGSGDATENLRHSGSSIANPEFLEAQSFNEEWRENVTPRCRARWDGSVR